MKKETSGGEPIFQSNISSRAINDRFMKYMDLVKRHQDEVPIRSGTDNEMTPNDFAALEDLYARYDNAINQQNDNFLALARTKSNLPFDVHVFLK